MPPISNALPAPAAPVTDRVRPVAGPILRWTGGLLSKLMFFEHGGQLLRSSAAGWVLSMWFLAGAMAVLEGYTWARILAIFLPPGSDVAAVLGGAAWGVAIWIIDANFATLDTSAEHRREAGSDRRPKQNSIATLMGNRQLRATVLRLSIICISMALSGPFLANTLDDRKVVQEIEARNAQAMAVLQSRVALSEDQKIATVEGEAASARRRLELETAGRGDTGHYGDGPAAAAIRENIVAIEGRLAQARSDRALRLDALASASPADLERTEGLVLARDNPDTRGQIRAELHAGQERVFGFPASHVIASALFMLLFLMLVLLKILQPQSVSIYFDDRLQEAYDNYRAGGFSDLPQDILPALARHDGPSPMGARRFDHWYYGVYLPAHDAVERLRAAQAAAARAEAELAQVRAARDATGERLKASEAELEAALCRRTHLHQQDRTAQAEVRSTEEKIMETKAALRRDLVALLEAEGLALEGERRSVRARQSEIDKALAERIPERLAAVVGEIHRIHDRNGIVDEATAPTLAAHEPLLAPLHAERASLLGERRALDVERANAMLELERIEAGSAAIAARLEQASAPVDSAWLGGLPPPLKAHREALAVLFAVRDELAAKAPSAESIAILDRRIEVLEAHVLRDELLLDEYLEHIRSRELAISGAGLKELAHYERPVVGSGRLFPFERPAGIAAG